MADLLALAHTILADFRAWVDIHVEDPAQRIRAHRFVDTVEHRSADDLRQIVHRRHARRNFPGAEPMGEA